MFTGIVELWQGAGGPLIQRSVPLPHHPKIRIPHPAGAGAGFSSSSPSRSSKLVCLVRSIKLALDLDHKASTGAPPCRRRRKFCKQQHLYRSVCRSPSSSEGYPSPLRDDPPDDSHTGRTHHTPHPLRLVRHRVAAVITAPTHHLRAVSDTVPLRIPRRLTIIRLPTVPITPQWDYTFRLYLFATSSRIASSKQPLVTSPRAPTRILDTSSKQCCWQPPPTLYFHQYPATTYRGPRISDTIP